MFLLWYELEFVVCSYSLLTIFIVEGLNREEQNSCYEAVRDDLYSNKEKVPLTEEQVSQLNEIIPFMEIPFDKQTSKPENSTKLNYLLEKIRSLPKNSKCIVFTRFNHTLRALLDALDT